MAIIIIYSSENIICITSFHLSNYLMEFIVIYILQMKKQACRSQITFPGSSGKSGKNWEINWDVWLQSSVSSTFAPCSLPSAWFLAPSLPFWIFFLLSHDRWEEGPLVQWDHGCVFLCLWPSSLLTPDSFLKESGTLLLRTPSRAERKPSKAPDKWKSFLTQTATSFLNLFNSHPVLTAVPTLPLVSHYYGYKPSLEV